MRIVHLTSAHPPFDIRIFHKECSSLAAAGYETMLIAPHDQCEVVDGVNIRPIPKMTRRVARMALAPWCAYREALRQNADVYHFHDPELIPVGLLLRARGKAVIYDVHEDLPQDILGKEYLPRRVRRPLALAFDGLERISSRIFSGMIAATPAIARRFSRLDGRLAIIQNFPTEDEVGAGADLQWEDREMSVIYAGAITRDRAIREMVEAMEWVGKSVGARLRIAGAFSPPGLRQEVQTLPGWKYVIDAGFLSRPRLQALVRRVRAGLVVFHPEPNNIRAQPNKLFEYMAAGIPVIASDFPLWRDIVHRTACGLLVNPLDPRAIADAIEYLLTHSSEAEAMGARGLQAVRERYRWDMEEAKLLKFYARFEGHVCAA